MPPRPKKRKQAKKKKQVANFHSTTNFQGNDDLKTHDGKVIDSGDISFPTSHEHHDPLAEEEEQEKVERRDSSFVGSVAITDSEPMEGSQNGSGDGEGESKQMVETEVVEVVEIIKELKPDEDSESKDVSIEYVQYEKDSGVDGSSRDVGSSSSSSSDEESPLPDNDSLVMDSGKLETEENGDDSAMEAAVSVDSAEPVVSLNEEVTQVVEETTSVMDTEVSDVIELESKEKEEKLLPSSDETAGALGMIDSVSKGSGDEMLQTSALIGGGGEQSRDSGIPGSSENQPLPGSAPLIVRPTSWKSCCGLFEVMRGSNR